LTAPAKYATNVVVSQKLTTTEAAKAVGLDRVTVQRWIRERKVNPPKTILRNGRGVRLWSSSDIERLSRVKELVYRRGRGRKPKPKA
jgi:excisionase family DNA binding protein